ncbi:hypothetical protein HWV62_39363 [Athelia sp. TMB]|nr:hypothetical protein HWV62_39363 [Athelia sp. TMB]
MSSNSSPLLYHPSPTSAMSGYTNLRETLHPSKVSGYSTLAGALTPAQASPKPPAPQRAPDEPYVFRTVNITQTAYRTRTVYTNGGR